MTPYFNETVIKIVSLLSSLSLKEQLVALAMVFINMGLMYFESENQTIIISEDSEQFKRLILFTLADIEKNGNTIANSLVMQGLTILEWVNR